MKAIAFVLMLAWWPVQAGVIAQVSEGPVRVELHDQTGYCARGAHLALWIEGSESLTGCWRILGTVVQIAWSDADVTRIPAARFETMRGI